MRAKKNKTTANNVKMREQVMHDALDFLMGLPDISEAFTRAELELALDDRGWINYTKGGGAVTSELDDQQRLTLVSRSRAYWQRDPLAKQSVRVWTDYALGEGMSYQSTDPAVQIILDKFCKNPWNRGVMNSEGQRKSSKKLLVDGDVFFAVYDESPVKTIRRLEPLQITDLICDPDDEERVLGYKRKTAKNATLFYADWKCKDEDISLLEAQKDPENGKIIGQVEEDVVVYHLAFDTLGKRGNGLLFSVLDWSKEHRRFMEARVAIVQALSKFAWKTTVKGGQGVVNQMKAKIESTFSQGGMTTPERHPKTADASTWLQNAGVNTEPMPRSTGGGESKSDGDQLKLMVSAGTGIMLHYYGDPSTGNLATATAMELPMLKMFAAYQKLWTDAYRDIFSIVLGEVDSQDEQDGVADDNDIDIDLPPILAEDLQKLAAFLTAATTMFPELKVREVLQMLLVSLGINNIDEVLKAVDAKRKEIDTNVKAGLNPDGSKPIQPAVPLKPQEAAELVEAMQEVARLLDINEWPDTSGEDDHGRDAAQGKATELMGSKAPFLDSKGIFGHEPEAIGIQHKIGVAGVKTAVDPMSLKPTQPDLDPKQVKAYFNKPGTKLPQAVMHEGKLRIVDGHHRVAAAIAHGKTSIQVEILQHK